MDFKEILMDIVSRVDGARAALIMGYDGISIDEYIMEDDDIDIQPIAIEYSNIVRDIKRASGVLDCGNLTEVTIATEKSTSVMRAVTEDYFILLSIHPDGNFGKGRYLLKLAVPKLKEIL